MSAGRPKRCTGIRLRKSSRASFVRNEIISVSTKPGATAFTVTPYGADLRRERLREGDERSLGRGVVRLPGAARERRERRDVHDASPAAPEHAAHHGLRRAEGPPRAVSITRFQLASGMSAKRPFFRTAALFTSTSTPSRSCVEPVGEGRDVGRRTSRPPSRLLRCRRPPGSPRRPPRRPVRVRAVGEDRVIAVGGEALADGPADAPRRAA